MSEEGIDYAEALAEAQGLGYAERDPTADVEGFDARAKAAILAGIAFNADVVAERRLPRGDHGDRGLRHRFAHRLGYEVKLLAVAERVERRANAGRSRCASIRRWSRVSTRSRASAEPFNAVFVEGEAAGELMFYGRGAGGTADGERGARRRRSTPRIISARRHGAAPFAAQRVEIRPDRRASTSTT